MTNGNAAIVDFLNPTLFGKLRTRVFGVSNLPEGQYEPKIVDRLRERDERNLRLARLFVRFNPNSGYLFREPPKSRLYSRSEIARTMEENGFAPDMDAAQSKADELITRGAIVFYFASRGIAATRITPHETEGGSTMYRFECEFCDDCL